MAKETLNYIETLHGNKQISSDAFGAEGGLANATGSGFLTNGWYRVSGVREIVVRKRISTTTNGKTKYTAGDVVGMLKHGEYVMYWNQNNPAYTEQEGFCSVSVSTPNIAQGWYLISESDKKHLKLSNLKDIVKTGADGISAFVGNTILAGLHNKVGRAHIVTIGVFLRFLHPSKFPDSLFIRDWTYDGKTIRTYNSVKSSPASSAAHNAEMDKFILDTKEYLKLHNIKAVADSHNQVDDYRLLHRLVSKIIGKHYSAEGLFMNELIDGKPIGVADPAIHDGGFDANAGKNPPEEGEMHIGFKMGGGAYNASGESKPVGVFEAEKGLSAAQVHGMATWQIASMSAVGGVATAFVLFRYMKAKSWEAGLIGALAGTAAYFIGNKIINKTEK